MRIVCPRCVAQYEVDENAIPETGREVQCANCENIWFQDFIEMLPHRADTVTSDEATPEGVFDDLDGKSEVPFRSSRKNPPIQDDSAYSQPEADDDTAENILAETPDPHGFDDDDDFPDADDDAPNPNLTAPPIGRDVLDVLRSEAAFSSARAKLDTAAAQALDGDGAERKHAADQALAVPAVSDPADDDIALDELTAFLDAHSNTSNTAPEPDDQDQKPEINDPDPAKHSAEDVAEDEIRENTAFDPLSDLDAIRSQLDNIQPEPDPIADDTSEYTPVLPADDPVPPPPSLEGGDIDLPEEDEAITDLPEDRADKSAFAAAIAAVTAEPELEPEPIADEADFEDEPTRPRRAYRADGSSEDTDTGQTDDTNASPPLAAAAAAVGLSRPRPKGTRARARILAGFEPTPSPHSAPDDVPQEERDDLSADITAIVEETPPEEIIAPQPDRNRRPKSGKTPDRKALLPDVDELDASLRSEADQPRRRDREMREAHDEEVKRASGGGFRRAFIWTLFIIALLMALYVMRPAIISALPVAAVILDPYAAAIDSFRFMIDRLIG